MSTHIRARSLVLLLAALGLVVGLTATVGVPASASTPKAKPGKKPNIVFILTDDLDRSLYFDAARFPKFNSLLVDKGTTFSNHFVTDSLCCPSRSSILRRQFVHNHDVRSNRPPLGGFDNCQSNGDEQSTIATWLHDAGYRTGLLGKYLNGYPKGADAMFVPPGWDVWASPTGNGGYSEYNYQLNENGNLVRHGASPQDYLVDVLSQKS